MRLVSAIYGDCYPFDLFFHEAECVSTREPDDLKEGDVLIVWGGEDISPTLYNNPLHPKGSGNPHGPSKRDKIEWDLMVRANELNLPIIGICRGAQMLCALSGGWLVQDVDGHYGYHEVNTIDGEQVTVNSIHHQMLVPNPDKPFELVAFTDCRSKKYHHTISGKPTVDHKHPTLRDKDPEFVYFPETRGFAIQWHPEMMHANAPATQYVVNYIKERI